MTLSFLLVASLGVSAAPAKPAGAVTEITATAVSGASRAAKPAPIVVMPLTSLGSTDEAMQVVERVLEGELRKIAGDRLLTYNELRDQQKKLATYLEACDGVLDCLNEVFGAFGWAEFMVSNLAGLGQERVINLKLVNVRTGNVVRRTSEPASGDERELISHMRKAAVLLLAPERFTGILEVHALQPGVQILVDGQLVGTVPMASPRLSVLAGRHAVEAHGEGLVSFSSMLDVAYEAVVPVTINLPANTLFVGGATPYRARWWPWLLGAVGVVAAGAGGYFYYDHVKLAGEIEKDLSAAGAAKEGAWHTDLLRARISGGVGGALITTVSVLFISDFM
jgi:hypothetical protein